MALGVGWISKSCLGGLETGPQDIRGTSDSSGSVPWGGGDERIDDQALSDNF